MITLRGVTKYYQDKCAVRSIDLDVPAQSVFGLIGPNGAGKTTSLKMVATLIKPDAGDVTVGGMNACSGVREVRRLLGYMPDTFGNHRAYTSKEYLEFFGRAYGYGGKDLKQRLEGVLELTDLGRLRDEMVTALSAGMKQRLSLAKTLLHDPQVLVLDEPASGLDPRARIEIRSLLKELARMGKTILISSHILADLEEICTHVAIIEVGEVICAEELRKQSSSRLGHVRVRVEVDDTDVSVAQELLKASENVARVESTGNGKIDATVKNGMPTNPILEALVREGIEIVSFSREPVDLEALFLRRTKGIVS